MDFGDTSSLSQLFYPFTSPLVPGPTLHSGLQSLHQAASHSQVPSPFFGQTEPAPGQNPEILQQMSSKIWNLQMENNDLKKEVQVWK
jgi:hypothetical protein